MPASVGMIGAKLPVEFISTVLDTPSPQTLTHYCIRAKVSNTVRFTSGVLNEHQQWKHNRKAKNKMPKEARKRYLSNARLAPRYLSKNTPASSGPVSSRHQEASQRTSALQNGYSPHAAHTSSHHTPPTLPPAPACTPTQCPRLQTYVRPTPSQTHLRPQVLMVCMRRRHT